MPGRTHFSAVLGPAFELALAAALLAAALWTARGLTSDWARVSELRRQNAVGLVPRAGGGLGLDTLGGIAAGSNRPLLLEIPAATDGFVVFVVHAASLQKDVALWRGVAQRLATHKGLMLIAYCDSLACSEQVRAAGGPQPFAIVGFAEYRTARALALAGARGQALRLDPRLNLVGPIAWTDASQPSAIARAIGGSR